MKILPVRWFHSRLGGAYAAHPQRLRIAFLAVLAVVVVLMSVKYAAKIAKPGDSGQQSRSAFLRWRHMINAVFDGENIYVGVNEYPNPPIMAILLKPFASLPPGTGALAWFYAKVLMAVLAAVWTFRLVGKPTPRPSGPAPRPSGPTPQPPPCREGEEEAPLSDCASTSRATAIPSNAVSPSLQGGGWGVGSSPDGEATPPASFTPSPLPPFTPSLRKDLARAAAIVLCLPALLGDLSHNNVNIFILFLVAGCLEAFRRRLDSLAGLTLALAVACKVTPMLFVAYFAWKRCWRMLAATLAGLVLWLAIVPGLAFGWDRNRELITGWYALMIERPLLKGEITSEHPNQAVVGFVYRLFTHSPSYIEYPNNIPTPAEYHNLTDIGRPTAWVVVKVLTALFVLAVVGLCRCPVRGPGGVRQGWRVAAECGLICLGMLLFSERTWKHHAVTLLLPLAALTYALACVELPRRLRGCLFGILLASFILMAGPGLLHGRAADLAMVYGTHTVAFVLLTAAVGLLLGCQSERVDGSGRLNAVPITK